MKRFAVALALAAAGCSSGHERVPAFTQRDSAGITIVENTAPERADAASLELEPIPALDLGASRGDPHQEFGWVTGAFRLSSGNIVVGDGENSAIRIFDSSGTWLRDLGRKGSGPGEFVDLMALFLLPGDTIAAWDLTQRRVTRFTEGGALADTRAFVSSEGERSAPDLMGFLPDGRLVVQSWRFTSPRPGTIVQRDSVPIRIYSATLEPIDSILSLPETEAVVVGTGNMVFQSERPFGKRLQLRVAGDRLLVGTGDSYEIREYDPAGRLRRIVRRTHDAAPVTAADIAAIKAARRALRRASRQQGPDELDDGRLYPERKPHFGDITLAGDGTFWIKDYDEPATNQPTRCDIFSPEGHWLGYVMLPARFRPFQIGAGFVLGVQRDDDDIPHVVLFHVRPGARAGQDGV